MKSWFYPMARNIIFGDEFSVVVSGGIFAVARTFSVWEMMFRNWDSSNSWEMTLCVITLSRYLKIMCCTPGGSQLREIGCQWEFQENWRAYIVWELSCNFWCCAGSLRQLGFSPFWNSGTSTILIGLLGNWPQSLCSFWR